MRQIAIYMLEAVLLVGLVSLYGCPKVEQQGYNTVVAAKAFLDTTKAQHPECGPVSQLTVPPQSTVCADLIKATSAKDTIIDALEVFCAGPDFNTGGVCTAPSKGTPAYTQAVAKLQAAIAAYDQTAKDLQGVLR